MKEKTEADKKQILKGIRSILSSNYDEKLQ